MGCKLLLHTLHSEYSPTTPQQTISQCENARHLDFLLLCAACVNAQLFTISGPDSAHTIQIVFVKTALVSSFAMIHIPTRKFGISFTININQFIVEIMAVRKTCCVHTEVRIWVNRHAIFRLAHCRVRGGRQGGRSTLGQHWGINI